ncbi:MAG: His-Xaa-Ser system protein HxsD [Candidatus Parcubacteria bacterium]|nr:His-Xaa-Ser system protein HxsD [Candidatus Parcubacteria bacterium]
MKNKPGIRQEIKEKEGEIKFTINTKIYSVAAIYQAAYFFLDKVYVFLDGDPKKEIKVIMKSKEDAGGLEKIAGEFYNELLNQLLREKVSLTNAKIREYIVSQALYNAVPNEVDELLKEVEEEDWQEDPLGISKPWEDQKESDKGKRARGAKRGKGKKGK